MKFNDFIYIKCTSPLANNILINIENTNLCYIKTKHFDNMLFLSIKNKKNIHTPVKFSKIVTNLTKEELFEQLELTYEYIKLKYCC